VTIHSLRFWTAIFITTALIIIAVCSLSRKKQKLKVRHLENQKPSNSVTTEKESVKQKPSPQKEAKPETKVYTNTSIKSGLEVIETKPVYIKPTETKQEKSKPKVEALEIKPKAKPKNKEQLPKAKVETTISKDEVVFVNYEFLNVETTNSYPVSKFPKKGTVVRSYRLGNTKRRGFKEESFQKSIEQYFGKDFTVIGNARLNTGKETRPFEPDIAIIDNSNITNLRIDIEIDEPYAGISRQPTHCKGEDISRDNYFIDRGWVVIRFTEYQVHLQENDCLRFIAEKIKLAIPKYNIADQIVGQNTLQAQNFWDNLQAQKWEKEKYREQYLNHTFQTVIEQNETIDRDFDDQELREEKLVKATLIGETENKKLISINLQNANVRDSRIKFYPERHIYTIDNIPAPSASTIIAKFFPEFDTYYRASNLRPSNPLYGLSVEEIVEIWNLRGIEAANQETYLHEQIEKFYLGQEYVKTEEFHLFEQFCNEHQYLKPNRTEWRVFDEEFHIAGTIDLIAKNGSEYELYDWKRSKKLIKELNGNPNDYRRYWGNFGVGKLAKIRDTSQNRYCIQLSMYKYILEKNYGLTVSKMFLIALHPDYDQFHKIEVPYLKNEIKYILQTL
jgi:hypothetical protein